MTQPPLLELTRRIIRNDLAARAYRIYPNNERMRQQWLEKSKYLLQSNKHAAQTGAYHPELRRFSYWRP